MALIKDLIVEQGTSFSANLNIAYANGAAFIVTGYTANSVFRKHYSSNTFVAFTTTVYSNTSVINVALTANQTSNLEHGRYVWDLAVSNGSIITRVLEGILTLSPGVTT